MVSDEEWLAFNPGFDRGDVEQRQSNVDGVFSADKLRDLQGADVRRPNVLGQVGSETFDWSSVDAKGADLRAANCCGTLGAAFDWSAIDPTGEYVRLPNLPNSLDADAFTGVDLSGADVRGANVPGQIGDAGFVALVASKQTPLTAVQAAWRHAVLPLALALPAALSWRAMQMGGASGLGAGALLASVGLLGLFGLSRRILMVKMGTVCFAQFLENGATHVLQPGVHLLASFGTSTKCFDIKDDHMTFGTISFVRVRPGFIGRATDSGMPVLLLPGQHLYNEANFEFLGVTSVTTPVISTLTLHLIRIPPGNLGLATINKKPILLTEGMHFVNSPGFEWAKQAHAKVTDNVITNGPLSIIRVQPGFLGLGTSSKRPVLLGAGLHWINDVNFEWREAAHVASTAHIRNDPISLVRVPPGHVGLATINKAPLLLDEGMHLVVEPTFEYAGARSINDDLIALGPIKIVRVGPGYVGLASMNGVPLLLETGVHFVNEPSFIMHPETPLRKMDEPIISHGPLHVITVPRGQLVPVLVAGEGHFLLEGRHFLNQPRLVIKSAKMLTDEYASAGTRHRIVVPRGKLGLALEAGEPRIYEPGSTHLVNSAMFEYRGSVDITQQVVAHGSLKIVTVKDGQVGITYNEGVLELLQTGRHTIGAATHVLAGFVSTGQQTLRISEVTGMTLDNVEITFDAAIAIRVVDAQKAVVMLTSGKRDVVEELQENVQERAKLDLCTIIGKNRFNKKHDSTASARTAGAVPSATVGEEGHAEDSVEEDGSDGFEKVANATDTAAVDDESSGFRSAVHDRFMVMFKEEMLSQCGVEVINMAVEDVRIVDHELAKGLAAAAIANSALEKQTIDAEIVQVKAAAEAKVALLDAQGRAEAMKILARAEADRIGTVSAALDKACPAAQAQEAIKASGSALENSKSTVLLAQDMGALGALLGGAQGSKLGPRVA